MSDFTQYNEPRPKKKKRAKITPKMIFGIFCGTALLFIISFLLSYMLMNHSLPMSGSSLAEENKELKERIEDLETRLEKYEEVDDFSQQDVPEEYTGSAIIPGGSEPAVNDTPAKSTDKADDKAEKASKESNKKDGKDDDNTLDETESAFEGIVDDDDNIPANTGVSDAPVIVN